MLRHQPLQRYIPLSAMIKRQFPPHKRLNHPLTLRINLRHTQAILSEKRLFRKRTSYRELLGTLRWQVSRPEHSTESLRIFYTATFLRQQPLVHLRIFHGLSDKAADELLYYHAVTSYSVYLSEFLVK